VNFGFEWITQNRKDLSQPKLEIKNIYFTKSTQNHKIKKVNFLKRVVLKKKQFFGFDLSWDFIWKF
jgi:hypothetical protein